MNFDVTPEQEMVRETFARFLDDRSTMAQLRAAQADARDLLDLTASLSLSLFKREGAAGLLNQCYRHAHSTTIYGGTSQVHHSVIAETVLGLPRTRG